MSGLGPGYNPKPPRAWYRVQIDVLNNPASYQPEKQMLLKGNILQYKKNSSNLTKQQRYSQIAKGQWTNRTKSWASQTQTSTNPNTSSLLRVNYESVPLIDPIIDPFGCITTIIKNGGTLVGNTVVNPCTDEIIQVTTVEPCNPTSASNVPGQIVPLCWTGRVQTWYPRTNLTMNTTTDKWPVNYKLFKSANDLVSGTEVSQDFLNQNNGLSSEEVNFPNSLNDFNISNIYSNIVQNENLIEQGPFNLNLSENYDIVNAGVYIIQTSIENITIFLPERIGNLNTVTIINKSANPITVSVTNMLQFIYNVFFAVNDKSVILSSNTIGDFKFVIDANNITDAGLWYLNLH